MNTTANQSTAANRRPDGQSDGSGDFVSAGRTNRLHRTPGSRRGFILVTTGAASVSRNAAQK
jgi:hypothetical protein